MKYFVVFAKFILLIFLWLIAIAMLGSLKRELVAYDVGPLASSVLWMAYPMILIMAFIFFYRGKALDIEWINKVVAKIESLLGILFVGKIFLFLLFGVVALFGSFFIMYGIHVATLKLSFDTLFGILLFIMGIFISIFSNSYFNHK